MFYNAKIKKEAEKPDLDIDVAKNEHFCIFPQQKILRQIANSAAWGENARRKIPIALIAYIRGAPDPARYPVNLVDPGQIRIQCIWIRFGSEVGSSKYWLDLHNCDIKHHSMFSFEEMTHDNTELYMKTQ